ncbi:glycoside hydrolase family 25 protein [Paenibacillus sp. FSL K6-0108]|uniref:glycoside hydrolase family 25 protein n=1 Tax=Paenibacillus sp. FSL K6-0108 TaxID=2921417 RepID=UPI003249DBBE
MQARKTGNAQGIDVSHHNGNIDFKKVAADGISFVFIKATQGKSFRSSKFLQFVRDAKAAGLLIGVYHYVDDSAGSVEAAKAEAQNFYRAIQDAGGIGTFDLPPVMDYESNKNGHSKATITAVATTFLSEIHKLTGIKPLVYTYPAFIGNFSGLSGYPLWIARYSSQTPADASGWTRWDFWQYSDGTAGGYLPRGNRKVDGISGNVDLNEFDGTVAELKAKYSKTVKEDKPVTQERDINVPSKWAETVWKEVTEKGFFDGTRPGANVTREELGAVVSRMLRYVD